jgi:hypothetical protein
VTRNRVSASSPIVGLLVVGLAVPTHARAAGQPVATAKATVPEAAEGDPLAGPTGLDPHALVRGEDAAYQAYMRGKRAFEANDFDRALVDLGDALKLLPDEAPYARSRGSIAMWMIRCHGVRYLLRGDLAELDREVVLLDAYAARLDAIAANAEDRAAKAALVEARRVEIASERQRVSGEHGDVDTQIDRSLRGEYAGVVAATWVPRVEDLAWYRRRDDPRPKGKQADDLEPETRVDDDPRGRRPGTGLIASGAIVLGVGLGALTVMAVGMARAKQAETFEAEQTPNERRDQIGRGLSGNAMAAAGAAVGATAVVAGVVLVAVGAKRRRADAKRVSFTPTAGPRGGGASIKVRF